MVNHKQTDWDKLTPFVVHSYNNTTHTSTGFSPTYLNFGREIEIPFDLCMPVAMPRSYNKNKNVAELTREFLSAAWRLTSENIETAHHAYKFYHDLNVKGHEYKVGDTVYIWVPRTELGQVKKFTRCFHGPYIITSLRGLNAYVKIMDAHGDPIGVEFMAHLERLKKTKSPLEHFTPAEYVSRKRPTTIVQTPASDKPVPSVGHSYNLRPRQ
ncbi:uncharacterized protein [Watersipora subatra]|uniref:uncharacterized protein n=1 Tax=Watersipora subatra TaxID=2589382 RepID=UPI00355AEF24